ncbi:hypothetical protein Bbelb_173730 [Branchiostoma belcheri]|nr:hypothetical protein Bbelb_173730 [Branchiostoma belcheri]
MPEDTGLLEVFTPISLYRRHATLTVDLCFPPAWGKLAIESVTTSIHTCTPSVCRFRVGTSRISRGNRRLTLVGSSYEAIHLWTRRQDVVKEVLHSSREEAGV